MFHSARHQEDLRTGRTAHFGEFSTRGWRFFMLVQSDREEARNGQVIRTLIPAVQMSLQRHARRNRFARFEAAFSDAHEILNQFNLDHPKKQLAACMVIGGVNEEGTLFTASVGPFWGEFFSQGNWHRHMTREALTVQQSASSAGDQEELHAPGLHAAVRLGGLFGAELIEYWPAMQLLEGERFAVGTGSAAPHLSSSDIRSVLSAHPARYSVTALTNALARRSPDTGFGLITGEYRNAEFEAHAEPPGSPVDARPAKYWWLDDSASARNPFSGENYDQRLKRLRREMVQDDPQHSGSVHHHELDVLPEEDEDDDRDEGNAAG
jgi:hypothetical protein